MSILCNTVERKEKYIFLLPELLFIFGYILQYINILHDYKFERFRSIFFEFRTVEIP